MFIELPLKGRFAKIALLAATLVCCILLGLIVFANFVIDALADQRASVTTEALAVASSYFPASARLNARLARAEMEEEERDLELARFHASRAVALSPSNYNNRTLLAYIDESRGDRTAAEDSLKVAMSLAPYNKEVHWRLANLLLREGKLSESVDQFRAAVSVDPSYMPSTLELLWPASGGNVQALESVAGSGSLARFALAQFLLKRLRVAEAASVFGKIDPRARYDTPEGSAFLATLIKMGFLELARALWTDLVSPGKADRPLVWNGGFESDIVAGFSQFDWTIAGNSFARISIDVGGAHSGSRSLRVDFTGRDTTRLDDEIKQLIVVRPGARYRLACYVKTEGLVTPEGPRIAVVDQKSQASIASSDAISPGSSDWKPLSVDFDVSRSSRAVLVSIKRIPKFSYDKPTSGTIWIDDFNLTELPDNSPQAPAR
jgi:hypothetical protein